MFIIISTYLFISDSGIVIDSLLRSKDFIQHFTPFANFAKVRLRSLSFFPKSFFSLTSFLFWEVKVLFSMLKTSILFSTVFISLFNDKINLFNILFFKAHFSNSFNKSSKATCKFSSEKRLDSRFGYFYRWFVAIKQWRTTFFFRPMISFRSRFLMPPSKLFLCSFCFYSFGWVIDTSSLVTFLPAMITNKNKIISFNRM